MQVPVSETNTRRRKAERTEEQTDRQTNGQTDDQQDKEQEPRHRTQRGNGRETWCFSGSFPSAD